MNMRYLEILLVFVIAILFVTLVHPREYKHKEHGHRKTVKKEDKKGLDMIREGFKVPGFIRRKFIEGSKGNLNSTIYFYSLPVTLEHINGDFYQLTAKFQKVQSTTLKIHLWMEFPDIKKTEDITSNQFLIDLIPIIGSREMAGYEGRCSLTTIIGKPQFPDDILEIKYDISSLYKACQAMDVSANFTKYEIRFYAFDDKVDINLSKDEVDIYLIFKELDNVKNIVDLLPDSKAVEPLTYDSVIRQTPNLRSYKRLPKPQKPCSLKPFTFNFGVSGWKDTVIAPKEYRLNKCHGRCSFPLSPHLNYTNYAIIKAVGSMVYKNMKKPCCIAQDLEPLFMLLCDEETDKISVKYQQDMVATSCRCA